MAEVTCLRTYRNKKLTATEKLGRVEFFRWWKTYGFKRGVGMSAYQSRVPIKGVMYKVIAGVPGYGKDICIVENSKGERLTITRDQLHTKHLAKY